MKKYLVEIRTGETWQKIAEVEPNYIHDTVTRGWYWKTTHHEIVNWEEADELAEEYVTAAAQILARFGDTRARIATTLKDVKTVTTLCEYGHRPAHWLLKRLGFDGLCLPQPL